MDVETVSGLSLTYSLQQRFRDEMGRGVPRLIITPATSAQEKLTQIQQTLNYLTDLVRAEQQLQEVYSQALEVIRKAKDPDDAAARPAGTPPTRADSSARSTN
jgi:hypothetical protein